MTEENKTNNFSSDFQKTLSNASMRKADRKARECSMPRIPIYPIRYGLTKDYIDKAKIEKIPFNKAIIKEIGEPKGMKTTEIHHLQQIRQGFIYIYAHTKHREQPTDKKGNWMVFRYSTNNEDYNSSFKVEGVDIQSFSSEPTFFSIDGMINMPKEIGKKLR